MHVAVLSVGRWEDYKQALQPTFELDPKQSLASAGQSTRDIEEQFLDALSIGLRLAPPRTSTTSQSTTTTNQAGTTTESTETSKKEPGSVSASSPVSSPALPSDKASPSPTLGVDPMAQYWAATALYQEVQLLDRYVRDAIEKQCFEAYVVRMQVSVMPLRRNLPYDTYGTFAFFSGPQRVVQVGSKSDQVLQGSSPDELMYDAYKKEAKKAGATESETLFPSQPSSFKALLDQRASDRNHPALPPPFVVPLLVTDNLESTTHGRTMEQVRQYALALSALVGGFGAGADVSRTLESLQQTVGRDYNSLLTIGRITDNAIRIRLGASQGVAQDYVTVPRTHYITALLLVPTETMEERPPVAHLEAILRLVDAGSGNSLQLDVRHFQDEMLTRYAHAYKLNLKGPACPYDDPACELSWEHPKNADYREECSYFRFFRSLLDGIESGDPYAYYYRLQSNRVPPPDGQSPQTEGCIDDLAQFPANAVFTDLVELAAYRERWSLSFELPGPRKPTLPSQLALFRDDGKQTTKVTLCGGSDLSSDLVHAVACVRHQGAGGATCGDNALSLESSRVTLSDARDCATFEFPSFAALAKRKDAGAAGSLEGTPISLELTLSTRATGFQAKLRFACGKTEPQNPGGKLTLAPVYLVADPEALASFELAATSAFIVPDKDSNGSLNVEFKFKPTKDVPEIQFGVRGADLVDFKGVSKPSPLADSSKAAISGDGTVQLSLHNLNVKTDVQITAWFKTSAGDPISKTVSARVWGAAAAPSPSTTPK